MRSVFLLAFLVTGSMMQQASTRLHKSQTSEYSEPMELALRTHQELAEQWRTMTGGLAGMPLPRVDFKSRMVIVLGLGPRRSGGYAIAFDSLRVVSGKPTVHYTVTSPGAGCMSASVMTSPVDVVSVPLVAGDVRFVRRDVAGKC